MAEVIRLWFERWVSGQVQGVRKEILCFDDKGVNFRFVLELHSCPGERFEQVWVAVAREDGKIILVWAVGAPVHLLPVADSLHR